MIGNPKAVIEEVVKLRNIAQLQINYANSRISDKDVTRELMEEHVAKREVFREFINRCDGCDSISTFHFTLEEMFKEYLHEHHGEALREIRDRLEFHTARLV